MSDQPPTTPVTCPKCGREKGSLKKKRPHALDSCWSHEKAQSPTCRRIELEAQLASASAECERLRANYAKLHHVVESYVKADGQVRGAAFREVQETMIWLGGERDDLMAWPACYEREKARAEAAEAEVARLRERGEELERAIGKWRRDIDVVNSQGGFSRYGSAGSSMALDFAKMQLQMHIDDIDRAALSPSEVKHDDAEEKEVA